MSFWLALNEGYDSSTRNSSVTSRFPEVRLAEFYGRREELLALLGKVYPGPTLHTSWSRVRSAARPLCGHYITAPEKSPSRGLPSMSRSTRCKPCHHNLVYHKVRYRTGSRDRRVNVAGDHSIPRGLFYFIKFSYQQVNNEINCRLCFL